jgi:hypothetical protein
MQCNVTFPDQEHATLQLRLTAPMPKAPQSIESSLAGPTLSEALGRVEELVPVILFELLYPRK